MPADPVRVGIAGLGRSGWNIHAATIGGHEGAGGGRRDEGRT